MKRNTADTIRALKQAAPAPRKGRSLTLEEGIEIVRAYRRGLTVREIAVAFGVTAPAINSTLGTWALHHCRCVERKP